MLTESIDQIAERFLRYGRANARLSRRHGRWRESIPGALDWYSSIASGAFAEYRCFREIASDAAREAFAAYDLILTASFLIGYLEQLQHEADTRLISVDHHGLRTGWHALADSLSVATAHVPAATWRALPIDFRLLGQADRTDDQRVRFNEVTANLRRHAPAAAGPPNERVQHVLDEWADAFDRAQSAARQRLRAVWHTIERDDFDPSVREFEGWVRHAGVPFGEGCHEIEKLLYASRQARQEKLSDDHRPR